MRCANPVLVCLQVELMKEGLESHGVKVRKATKVHGLLYFPCGPSDI